MTRSDEDPAGPGCRPTRWPAPAPRAGHRRGPPDRRVRPRPGPGPSPVPRAGAPPPGTGLLLSQTSAEQYPLCAFVLRLLCLRRQRPQALTESYPMSATATMLLISTDQDLIKSVRGVAASLSGLPLEVLAEVGQACTQLERDQVALAMIHLPAGGDPASVQH